MSMLTVDNIQNILNTVVFSVANITSSTSPTGTTKLAVGTTAQRDSTPITGGARYNLTSTVWEGWNGGNWDSFVTSTSPTGTTKVATGTTAQRDSTPTTGGIRFNLTSTLWEGWNGSAWGNLATGLTFASSNNNGVAYLNSSGVFTSGTILTFDGTDLSIGGLTVGYKNIPQNSQSTNYTTVLTDAGKHVFHPTADSTARTYTIPANTSVAYPIGTTLTFVNQHGAGAITISITTDSMYLAGVGTTGNRLLAANGIATAVKVASTEWLISGSGLT